MAYTTIDDPSAHFQTALYSGTGSSGNAVTNDGNSNLQPDIVWIKNRDYNNPHVLQDTNRGFSSGEAKVLQPGNAVAESNNGAFVSFDTNGFEVGGTNAASRAFNGSSDTYAAWQWKVNGGTTSSNTAGNVTNTLQVNTTAGISISTFTSVSSGTTTFGHGLGVVPAMFITKSVNQGYGWWVNHKGLSNQSDQYLGLHTTGDDDTVSWGAAPTSTLITTSSAFVGNNLPQICYAFAEIQGYSKFGKYTGTGSSTESYRHGPFIYTGFKPAFFICKRTDNTGNWLLFDNKRGNFNLNDNYAYINIDDTDGTSTTQGVDFLSNGIKIRNTYNDAGASNATYIYMAFAEQPFVTSTGIPTTAR